MPNVIADTMFLHERGAYNTLYFAFYFGSLMVSRIPNCATVFLISIRSDQLSQVLWPSILAGEIFGGSMSL